MVDSYGISAVCECGWNQFNRATLHVPEILTSAPEVVKKERTAVLRSRGVNSDTNAHIPSNQQNLLETGSGCLAGGPGAAEQLVRAAEGSTALAGLPATS